MNQNSSYQTKSNADSSHVPLIDRLFLFIIDQTANTKNISVTSVFFGKLFGRHTIQEKSLVSNLNTKYLFLNIFIRYSSFSSNQNLRENINNGCDQQIC